MSKIGNLSAMRALAKIFQVDDVRQSPIEIDTSTLKFVADVNSGGFAGSIYAWNAVFDPNFAGQASYLQQLINPRVSETSALLFPTMDTRVLGASFRMEFDVAGALAWNGKMVRVDLVLQPDFDASPAIVVATKNFTITTGNVVYTASMSEGNWNGLVPYGWLLRWEFESVDGTLYPANTSGVSAIAVVYKPTQTQLPQ